MIIKTKSFPRAALIGNPSDGYYGKTIAFVFSNYCAEILLYESPELDLLPSLRDHTRFKGIEHLAEDVGLHGYYGGIRLLKATIKKFYEYCQRNAIELDNRNFTIRYSTSIPNRLGLAGSSAIITACTRALKKFYQVKMAKPVLANFVLSVEKEELGIDAGLQDRVAQAYNKPVFMDFDREYMNKHGYGIYEETVIPEDINLYIAFRTDLSEGSEILHGRLRENYEAGDPAVLEAITEWSELTSKVKACLDKGGCDELPLLLDRNFDLRCEVCTSVSPKNKQMVEAARSVGASAKFTGSGGAIIGTYDNEDMFKALRSRLHENNIEVIKPQIVNSSEEAFE
ncbi:GHMP kinase [Lentisphaerota bacterium ZTH]|nr:GHMP kinase [Lentisphaerota bacterium]WET07404.1 GHMP kinase [Lentisphaerota bacterium ZTH]